MSRDRNKPEIPAPTINGARCLGVVAAAIYLGCTEWFVRETLIRGGKIPYRCDGKRYVIDIRDLDYYVEANKRGVAA